MKKILRRLGSAWIGMMVVTVLTSACANQSSVSKNFGESTIDSESSEHEEHTSTLWAADEAPAADAALAPDMDSRELREGIVILEMAKLTAMDSQATPVTITCESDALRHRESSRNGSLILNRITLEPGSRIVLQRDLDQPFTDGTTLRSGDADESRLSRDRLSKEYVSISCVGNLEQGDSVPGSAAPASAVPDDVDVREMTPGLGFLDIARLDARSEQGSATTVSCRSIDSNDFTESTQSGLVLNRVNLIAGSRMLLQRDLDFRFSDGTSPRSGGWKPYSYYRCAR